MKVSIIIPVFNSEAYLAKTLESALSQSWDDKEIIVVDDGSTDQSLQIAESFIDRGVKVFCQENNGACAARNRGFEESSGAYIQYLDADDLLSEKKIEHQMALAATSDYGTVISCRWVKFYNNYEVETVLEAPRFLDRDWPQPSEWLIHAWEGKGMAQTSIWLTPRHLVAKAGPWDERLSINQDGEFFCRVLLEASSIKYTDKSVVFYRGGNQGSVSQNRNEKKISDLLLSYKLCADNMLKKRDTPRIRQALAINFLSFIYLYDNRYPALSKQAKEYLAGLNLSKYPLVGGRLFKLMSSFIGFQASLQIKSILTK